MERGFYFLTLLFLSCSLLYSCKPQVPGEYLQPDEMEDILYDYHIALGMLDDNSDDGMKRTMYEMSVLREHEFHKRCLTLHLFIIVVIRTDFRRFTRI